MNDPLIARFSDACGATNPLDLRVDLAGGGLLAEGSVHQPYTLVGRDDACDVTLSDPEIDPRHAWIQVLGGRAFAVDLGSRTGLLWPSGARGSGWLDVGTVVRLGPFLFRLRGPAADRPSPYPAEYHPLAADPDVKIRPAAVLEFRNGRRAKDRWAVNRLITLIGRAPDCKIHLTADDIAPYHCGLVSTRTGLWVVDLSGRGVVVNGERMRVAALPQAAELWVGRFLIGCQYPVPSTPPPSARPPDSNGRPATARLSQAAAPVTADTPLPASPPPAVPVPTEDEVALGAEPMIDGLPASHIMADAFRQWGAGASGSMSNPIQVSASEPLPPPAASDESVGGGSDGGTLPSLFRRMAESQNRAAVEFQQSLALLPQMFGRVRREQVAALLHELNRIQELTAELTALQAEVARQTLEQAALDRANPAIPGGTDSGPVAYPSANTADPATARSGLGLAVERLTALQHDRATQWQALAALFGDS